MDALAAFTYGSSSNPNAMGLSVAFVLRLVTDMNLSNTLLEVVPSSAVTTDVSAVTAQRCPAKWPD